MRPRLLSGLVFAAPLASCAPVGTACHPSQPNPMPVYFNASGHPLVIAVVNGVPAAMVFDTGNGNSFVSTDLAKQANMPVLEPDGTLSSPGAGSSQGPQISIVHRFILGNAASTNMFMIIMQYDPGKDSHGQPIVLDGDLADDVTKNYDVDIDLPKAVITFYKSGWCWQPTPPWASAAAIPFKVDLSGDVYLPVTIDGKNLSAFLDTGTTLSAIPTTLFDSSGLRQEGTLAKKNTPAGATGGDIAEALYQFHQLSIGGVTVNNPIFGVETLDEEFANHAPYQHTQINKASVTHPATTPEDPYVRWTSGHYITLGEDFILFHRIFISYSTQMLYIQN